MDKTSTPAHEMTLIGEWAQESYERAAISIAAILKDGGLSIKYSLAGRDDRIAYAMVKAARGNERFARILGMAAKALKNKTEYLAIGMRAFNDGKSDALDEASENLIAVLRRPK